MLRIEPVGPADRDRALTLLAGGTDGVQALGRVARFQAMLSSAQAGRCMFWWARSLRGARAAAMTVRSPGRTAMIFYGPRGPRRANVGILARLLGELTDAALDGGLAFVQALLQPVAETDAEAFRQAGYIRLAQLIYLRRLLRDLPGEIDAGLKWEHFTPDREDDLARVIAETYVDSRDCPGLRGLRSMQDVIAGHKSNGMFRPQSWWMPTRGGECVGCVLVNDSAGRDDSAEVVYLGVRPAWRGRGLGRAMVRHALLDAARRGLNHMTLAVDAGNPPALRLYQKEGFGEVDRKDVYIKPAGKKSDSQ